MYSQGGISNPEGPFPKNDVSSKGRLLSKGSFSTFPQQSTNKDTHYVASLGAVSSQGIEFHKKRTPYSLEAKQKSL